MKRSQITPILALAIPVLATAATCNPEAIGALRVPNVTVESAAVVAAAGPIPEFCQVRGAVTTTGEGVPNGSAAFDLRLPTNWSGKFLFYGVGGLAGSLPAQPDSEGVLARGYAVAVTDAGHRAGGTDARWALTSTGAPDEAKIADYYYRAAHSVTVAAKQLVVRYFDGKVIQQAYFAGCSNGGRMALMEAQRYPDDYDGIIAGAPFMDMRVLLGSIRTWKDAPPDAYLPPATLAIVDQAVYAQCDAADGVKDGLIQNPARCDFIPDALLCKPGTAAGCLTSTQVEMLKRYLGTVRDRRGKVAVFGMPLTDLGGPGGAAAWTFGATPPDLTNPDLWTAGAPLGWQFSSHVNQFIVQRNPDYPNLSFDISPTGMVGDAALKVFDERTREGSPDDPSRLREFLRKDKKLILYHGFSDPALTPYRTMVYYEDLAHVAGGAGKLEKNVRLFMVPGMQHCGGGSGPDVFDTVTALDEWVAKGVAPAQMTATKFTNRRTGPVIRTMPLCKFPEQAHYKGSGEVNDASNWTCSAKPSLLENGPTGRAAGWKP